MVSEELLRRVKILMEIDPSDTKQDEKLKIEIEGAVEVVAEWFRKNACKPLEVDKEGFYVIPSAVLQAVKKYIEASRMTAGVKSESIAGMSVSFGGASGGVDSTGTPLDDLYAFLEVYRCNKIGFIPVRK